jgi:hypothetical protein
MLRLQRPKQCLLRAENLHRRRRVLGQVHQAPRVADEPRAHEFAHQRRQVRRDRLHARAQVFGELRAVLGNGNDLVAQRVDVLHVGVADFGAHRELGRGLDGGFEVFGEDEVERRVAGVGAEA